MAIRTDAPELAVDELRRRARRRLVGAIVLALAVAVALPLLLESDPKPLGDDVSIQIPPIDSGKFINPLSSAKAPDPKLKGGTGPGRNTAELPPPAPSGTAPAASAPSAKAVAPDSGSAAPVVVPAASAPSAPESNAAATESKPVAPAKSAADAPPAAAAAPASAAADSARTANAYVVQVAAFSDRYGANALASKLKHGGFPGFTEAVTTDQGTTLHRVRVGPYASREAADAALVKLKAAGFNGMVARVG